MERIPKCPVCNRRHTMKNGCDPRHLKHADDGRKAHEELRGNRERTSYNARLADGFDLLSEDDVVYEGER